MGPGLRASSKLIWFSWMAIWRSSSGIVEAVRERLEIAVSSSSLLETPPVEPRLIKSHRLVVSLHGAPGYFELQIQLP